jgi:hypothetical protein
LICHTEESFAVTHTPPSLMPSSQIALRSPGIGICSVMRPLPGSILATDRAPVTTQTPPSPTPISAYTAPTGTGSEVAPNTVFVLASIRLTV